MASSPYQALATRRDVYLIIRWAEPPTQRPSRCSNFGWTTNFERRTSFRKEILTVSTPRENRPLGLSSIWTRGSRHVKRPSGANAEKIAPALRHRRGMPRASMINRGTAGIRRAVTIVSRICYGRRPFRPARLALNAPKPIGHRHVDCAAHHAGGKTNGARPSQTARPLAALVSSSPRAPAIWAGLQESSWGALSRRRRAGRRGSFPASCGLSACRRRPGF